ncbi:MAG TPA: VOC family protein [Usitatibacter sp.]|nr:VOC family protein [Usitatibacter sp.]
MKIKRAAPVLFVDSVAASRDFFLRVGFTVAVEIPDGNSVGFSMLERDGVQVMVQSRDNSKEPVSIRARSKVSQAAHVYIEVDDLDAVIAAVGRGEILAERHKTFYGSDEITYQEPGGHLVTFAQFA